MGDRQSAERAETATRGKYRILRMIGPTSIYYGRSIVSTCRSGGRERDHGPRPTLPHADQRVPAAARDRPVEPLGDGRPRGPYRGVGALATARDGGPSAHRGRRAGVSARDRTGDGAYNRRV